MTQCQVEALRDTAAEAAEVQQKERKSVELPCKKKHTVLLSHQLKTSPFKPTLKALKRLRMPDNTYKRSQQPIPQARNSQHQASSLYG